MLYSPDETPWWIRILHLPQRIVSWVGSLGSLLVSSLEFCFGFVAQKTFAGVEGLEGLEFAVARLGRWLLWPVYAPARFLMRLMAMAAAFVARPMNAIFHGATRKVLTTLEVAEVAEVEARLGSLLLWPVRLIQRIFSAINWLLPSPVRSLLLAPIAAAAWIGYASISAFLYIAEALSLDTALAATVRRTRAIWYPIVAVIGFVQVWFVTRSRRQLAWGLPVLLVIVLGTWVAATNLLSNGEAVAKQYRRAVEEARDSKDYTRMQLFERKLAQLGVQTQSTDFRTALAFAEQGKYDEAFHRMRTLAPDDRPGYPNAHFWIIQNILSNRLEMPPEEGHRIAGAHFAQLDALRVKATSLDLMRAFWLAQENKKEEASNILKPLILKSPTAAIHRLRLDLAMKHQADAHSDAVAVSEHLHRQKRSGIPLTSDDYRSWAIAEDVLGNKIVARSVVQDWLAAQPGDKAARATLAAWSISELGEVLNDPNQDRKDLARRIEEAFSIENVPSELKLQVVAFYHQRAADPSLSALFDTLVENIAIPPALADALGAASASESDWTLAQTLLERCLHQDPHNSVAWNNLAFVMLKQNKDLDKALIAVNKALERQPENLHVRETRGEILVKLGRFQEAIPDLELALNGLPDSRDIHQTLAQAYDATGNRELAAIHRAAAN